MTRSWHLQQARKARRMALQAARISLNDSYTDTHSSVVSGSRLEHAFWTGVLSAHQEAMAAEDLQRAKRLTRRRAKAA